MGKYHAGLAIGVVNSASYNTHTQSSACISRKVFMTDQIYFPREVPFQVMCYCCAGHRNLVWLPCIQQVRANNGNRVRPEEAAAFAGKLGSLYNVRHILWATFFKTPQAERGSIIC